MAYQLVQTIRTHLGRSGINDSWDTLRKRLNAHNRVTSVYKRIDGSTLHVRKNVTPDQGQSRIYDALGIDAIRSTKKTIVPVANE